MQVVAERTDRAEPFQLKGGSYTLVVLKVIDPSDDRFFPQLSARVRQAPLLFRGAPLVLDFGELVSPARLDLPMLLETLRAFELSPIGAQHAPRELLESVRLAGLALIGHGRSARLETEALGVATDRGLEAERVEKPVVAEPRRERSTLLVTEPVRSGRRLYSTGDLVVLAPVSPGAELLADGHIHIYSSLRGRALAGLSGDRTARIFCQSLEAELISIAGLYRVSEDMDKKLFKKSVQIYLEEDRLRVEPLS